MTEKIVKIELDELNVEKSNGHKLVEKDYSLIKDVEVSLSALLGDAQISVEELFALEKGSVIALQTKIDEGVSIFIKDKCVAKGNIVAVEDSYGIEITHIL